MKKRNILFILLYLFVAPFIVNAQNTPTSQVTSGPESGTLVVVGGGPLDQVIIKRFIDLAGGPDAAIVVIPTAGGSNNYDENSGGAGQLRKYGATNVTVLHTNDRKIADTDAFVKPLLDAKAVWFGGGRQWRLVDAYKDTKTEQLFWDVLNRGGVIGGTSAGATIQGSYLARGDTKNNQIMMGDHEAGFGFIKNVAIDQHLLARNRHFDMFDILAIRPELLGIGIDESTAIVVKGDEFEVIGKSYALVFDGSFWSREGSDLKNLPMDNNLFYFLRSGDKYNMKEREVLTK
jgi:cyanophycinase